MKTAIAHLRSISPYSQSKHHQTPKKDKEGHADYEERTWRERMHYNKEGNVFIPPMQFANSLKEAAKYLSIPVQGKGKSTYTKNFEAGVMVVEPLVLPLKINDVVPETVHVPSDGRRGGTTRVVKTFGVVPEWEGKVKFLILDNIITKDVFMDVLKASGQFIGLGRFRPRNWGYYGRFEIVKLEWIEN